MDPYQVIKNPLSTEKSIRLMESENKLIFVIDKKATKKDVWEAVEKIFKVKVAAVNTYISRGQKRAYIRFSAETPAIDVATQLGLM
ncbi:MAG TPA: 50S ribosomal protein L23 [Candidatus Nanoarchaeia archaeon]|nr:50S ribosomal protein L23 [Candidatus Nanoarchaeia archaeon]